MQNPILARQPSERLSDGSGQDNQAATDSMDKAKSNGHGRPRKEQSESGPLTCCLRSMARSASSRIECSSAFVSASWCSNDADCRTERNHKATATRDEHSPHHHAVTASSSAQTTEYQRAEVRVSRQSTSLRDSSRAATFWSRCTSHQPQRNTVVSSAGQARPDKRRRKRANERSSTNRTTRTLDVTQHGSTRNGRSASANHTNPRTGSPPAG